MDQIESLRMCLGMVAMQYANRPEEPRGGGRLQHEMPGCVCWGSENVPILKDTLGNETKNTEGILSALNTNIMV